MVRRPWSLRREELRLNVLEMRMAGLHHHAIARKLGVTRERVRQLWAQLERRIPGVSVMLGVDVRCFSWDGPGAVAAAAAAGGQV
jgi:hypothetical protein